MSDDDFVSQLLDLSGEFSKLLMTDVALAAKIPQGAAIVFQIADQSDFNQRAMAIAHERHQREPALPVIIVHVDGLSPPTSRLLNPHLELATDV